MWDVRGLRKLFPLKSGILGSLLGREQYVHAVDGISFKIKKGEILGIVGESGCGKSTTGRLLVRLEDPTEGSMLFHGDDIAALKGSTLRDFRRRVQMIFQDPYESLNPRFTVMDAVAEPLIVHGVTDSIEARDEILARGRSSTRSSIPPRISSTGILTSCPAGRGSESRSRARSSCSRSSSPRTSLSPCSTSPSARGS